MPLSDVSLVLFTRVPIACCVKSRLMSSLSPQECADLQRAMTLDVVKAAADLPLHLIVCYGREWRTVDDGAVFRDAFLDQIQLEVGLKHRDMKVVEQVEGDLGDRMSHALEEELAREAGSCMLMGCDVPEVTSCALAEAVTLMGESEAVLCPSADGGYWLVGLQEPFPELFEEEAYGGPSVFNDALRVCRQHGRTVGVGPLVPDVDTPDDLIRLAGRASDEASWQHTADLVRKWTAWRAS